MGGRVTKTNCLFVDQSKKKLNGRILFIYGFSNDRPSWVWEAELKDGNVYKDGLKRILISKTSFYAIYVGDKAVDDISESECYKVNLLESANQTVILDKSLAVRPVNHDYGGYFGYGVYVESRKGNHVGKDHNNRVGTPVYSPLDGKVIHANQYTRGYGGMNTVKDASGNKTYTYPPGGAIFIESKDKAGKKFTWHAGHLDNLRHRTGQKVEAGELLGNINNYEVNDNHYPHLHEGFYDGGGMPSTKGWGYISPADFKKSNWRNPDELEKRVGFNTIEGWKV